MKSNHCRLPLFGLFALLALPADVAAGTIECPTDSQMLSSSYTRQYGLGANATSCIFGDGNLNGAGNDAFLNTDSGGGTSYGDAGWDLLDSTGSGLGSGTQGLITFSGTTSGGTWSFTDATALWATYSMLAIGLKDGATPQWAMFFLSMDGDDGDALIDTSGTWDILTAGGLSHGTLYGVRRVPCTDCDPFTTVPEPATLALLGLGLAGIAAAGRRRSRRHG